MNTTTASKTNESSNVGIEKEKEKERQRKYFESSAIKAILRPNQFFGETALLGSPSNGEGSNRRTASVYARTHVTLLSMKKPMFLKLMELLEDPGSVW